jgi:LEA14-like dessication related protein
VIKISDLTKKLKDIYTTFKNQSNPPVPIQDIKEFLELEGVELNEGEGD